MIVEDVVISGLCKSFGNTTVLHKIDLSIRDGEFVVFVGPSGCGKSTLLRLICGLEAVTEGVIAFSGEIVNDVPPAKRGIAMVFQSYALYPHMSVAQNMGYALRLAGTEKQEIDRRVREAATVLRLDALLDRKPRQLSGGQRQRVAIGRAIVRKPRIFLFDEPLSNLDASLRVEMRTEIASLKSRLGTTTIYVTHDQIEAMTLADRIVVMNAGRIEQVGTPLDLYREPANQFVAAFIGSPRMNIVPARTGPAGDLWLTDGTAMQMRSNLKNTDELHIGFRPEHCGLIAEQSVQTANAQGPVRMIEHLGSDVYVHVAIGDHTILVRHSGCAVPAMGETVGVVIDQTKLHVFGADGRRVAAEVNFRAAA